MTEMEKYNNAMKEFDEEVSQQNQQLTAALESAEKVFSRIRELNIHKSPIDDSKIEAFCKQISDKRSGLIKVQEGKAKPFL